MNFPKFPKKKRLKQKVAKKLQRKKFAKRR